MITLDELSMKSHLASRAGGFLSLGVDHHIGYASVFMAATLWATLGLFYKVLTGMYGASPLTIAFVRGLVAWFILVVGLVVSRPQRLRIQPRDLPFFAVMGLVSVAIFFSAYVYAVYLTSVAVAAVLLYTAPAFVTIMAWRIFGEPLGLGKMVALTMTFGGCLLVARAYDPALVRLNLPGLAAGLLSGFTYALYTILNKEAIRRYSVWTVLIYNLGFGLLFLLPTQSLGAIASLLLSPATLPFVVALGVGPTLVAQAAYVAGLRRVPASIASIIATWEPALAAFLGFAILGEALAAPQVAGMVFVMGGISLLSRQRS